MKHDRLRRLTLGAALAALTCVATMVIRIPSPLGGYFHLGDGLVLLCGLAMGPVWGACAAGIGSAAADLLAGFGVYAPATLVVKALTAWTAAMLLRRLPDKLGLPIGAVAGELVMAAGYFLFELALYSPAAAAENLLVTNLPQGAVGAVTAVLLYGILRKAHLLRYLGKTEVRS